MPPEGVFIGLRSSYMKWVSELQYRRELHEPGRKIKFLEIFKARSFPLTTEQRRPQREYDSDLDATGEYNTRLKSEEFNICPYGSSTSTSPAGTHACSMESRVDITYMM